MATVLARDSSNTRHAHPPALRTRAGRFPAMPRRTLMARSSKVGKHSASCKAIFTMRGCVWRTCLMCWSVRARQAGSGRRLRTFLSVLTSGSGTNRRDTTLLRSTATRADPVNSFQSRAMPLVRHRAARSGMPGIQSTAETFEAASLAPPQQSRRLNR